MKLTPWFPGSRKPAREGVYIRDMPGGALYAMWDGAYWLAASTTLAVAAQSRLMSINQRRRWRGLADQPKGVAAKQARAA